MKTTAKDFKMTELGPIPKDWDVKRLGEMFDIGSSKRVFQSQWRDSGIPFWRARDIVSLNEGSGAIGGLYIDADLYSQYKSQYGVPAIGDLLVTAVGTLGEVYRVKDDKPFYFKDGNIIWLRNRGVCDSQFVEVLFSGDRLDEQIYDTAGGSTVGTYTITNANKTLIPLPPLPEQRKIAAALSDVDEMIAALEKLIEKKRKIKTGAMQRLLTGKTRLPGSKGAWVEKRLGDVLQIGHGKDYKHLQEGRVPVYGTGGLMTYVNEYLYDGETVCIGRKGTIDRPFYHDGKIWTVDTLFFTHSFVEVVPRFLAYKFEQVVWLSYNEATGVPSLTSKAIEDVVITVPPTLAEQKAIAKVLGDMDEEIAALEAELAKTRQLKQGMMQELLTGKTRLI